MSRPVVLTGGGTGGHVLPLRALIEAFLTAGESTHDLLIVGSSRGQDDALVGDLDVEMVLLPGRGLRRSASPRAIAQNLGAVWGLVIAFVRSVVLVFQRRPRAVVSVGGYASAAMSVAAVACGRPLVLVDLDATPGLVHRWLRPFAVAIATAYPSQERRAVVTGAPLRDEIAAVARGDVDVDAARARLGLDPAAQVVAIVSGSLGAASVNRAACDLARRWHGRVQTTIYHVTGHRDFGEVSAAKRDARIGDERWRVVEFESKMADVWAACDVAVSRAGGTTVAELCATGVPSLLVALPGAPDDHQHANADVLARAGAAAVLDDAALSGELLDDELSSLFRDPARRASMGAAARSLARPDAASRIVEVVLDHVR